MTDEYSKLISESFRDKILQLALNIHGNHVIQICLDIFTQEEYKEQIYESVLNNTVKIATDKHGCCVV